MQAADSLHKFDPGLVGNAANQDFLKPKSPTTATTEAPVSLGWDPQEVWRRMIKEPRERRLTQGS